MKDKKGRFETTTIHSGSIQGSETGALVTPIYQTSTFVFEDIGKTRGYDYSRSGNPTRKALEDTIAELEGGRSGFAFATGMAAEATIMHLLRGGDHVISQEDVYGGTYRLFNDVMSQFGMEFTFLKMESSEEIEAAIRPNTRMIWIETMSNPLLKVLDLEMVVDIAKRHNLITVADNTLPTPYLLRPIEMGIDVVVHSTTKYLNGHCDVVGGAAVCANEELSERVQFLINAMGTCASPFDCWLVLRGLKTLPVRMEQHGRNALRIVDFLQGHPVVNRVYHPAVEMHPSHELASRIMKGNCGMVSFEVEGGLNATNSFLRKLKLFSLAESLGGVDSLAEHPATMSHASMPQEYREAIGITDSLIRLSVGLENIDDLIEDLKRALD